MLGYNPERQRELMSWFGMRDADWLELAADAARRDAGRVRRCAARLVLRRFARPDPVQAAWRAFCRKLGARGVARAPHEGPRDYARARAARGLPGVGSARSGASPRRHIALRYGKRPRRERTSQSCGALVRAFRPA
mgnify:CR=1 FL=1